MHRILFGLISLAALYVTTGCTANHAPAASPASPPAAASAPATTQTPTASMPALPASAPVLAAPPVFSQAPNAQPHIALLLPLKSVDFQRAAEVVQQGFLAAHKTQPGSLPIRLYACADESKEIAALYQQALANGAQAVVGPLTPAGVAVLAAQPSIPVPTLALNRADAKTVDNLYFFGLALEGEARQVARLAAGNDAHAAIIVSTDTPLSKRLVAAFTGEWKKLGGDVAATRIFKGDTSIFADLPAEPGNMVFVASNAEQARRFRPFLNAMLPVYATSQIFNGNAQTLINYDLRDVVFVDMPWLLEQDQAGVIRYARATPPLQIDMERLYALGIDSYRLIRMLVDNRSALPQLDGVTGTVHLGANHQFEREAVMAEFKQGQGLTAAGLAALKAANKAAREGGAGPAGDPTERE